MEENTKLTYLLHCTLARDLRSKMSRIQLAIIVKSFRVSLCEQPPKKIVCGTPEWVGQGLVSQTIASLPALAGKLQTQFSNPFWGPSKENFWRLLTEPNS